MKCSLHIGKKYSAIHNLREYDENKWNKDGHIDKTRSGSNEILEHKSLEKFFDEQFGSALLEFNLKQRPKHSERLIGFKNAGDYDKCPDEERREKAVRAYLKDHSKSVQEAIIQLGNHDNYMDMVEQFGSDKADKIYKDYLISAYEKWKDENPSLVVFSAVIHMGETKDGSPHLHLDFLPVAESSRGLKVKVGMESALKKIGFSRNKNESYHETAYKKWLRHYRAEQENAAQIYSNENKLGIIILHSEKSKAGHSGPQEYEANQARVKISAGKVKDFFGADKKLREQAAV